MKKIVGPSLSFWRTLSDSQHKILADAKKSIIVMSVAMTLAFATWMALLNNFVIERAAFTGAEIGMLQSIREIPGF